MDVTDGTGALAPAAARAAGQRAGDAATVSAMARRLGLLVVAGALTLCVTVVLVHPPAGHVVELAAALAVGAGVSVALGEAALRLLGALRVGGVRAQLAAPPLLTAAILSVNVLALAQLMFISVNDSRLLLAFLLFGSLVALVVAWTLAGRISASIARIESGAREIAAGNYACRLDVHETGDSDELARLAQHFNAMAAEVQHAFQRRDEAEAGRRHVIAAVSHDLRTPVASIRAMIEAIDDGVVSDTEAVRRYQRAIRSEVRHVSLLMDELFDLARLESGALDLARERLALDDLLSDALEATHEWADRAGVHLAGRVDGTLPPVWIDPRHIHRVLLNLTQNALRHTPPGGVVLLRASSAPLIAPPAMPGSMSARPMAHVQVLDAGEGIAARDLPHIFERTYRGETARTRHLAHGDGASAGAGLGLAIARGIVEVHGGTIWAASPLPDDARALLCALDPHGAEAGTGAAVCFALPPAE